MDTAGIDRKLLQVFESLMATRSVSLSAASLGMSQPSVSYSLNGLRTLTGDPLFVRVKNRMEPTPHAQQLAIPIRRVLEIIELEILARAGFTEAESTRQFTLCMTDIGEAHYMPGIVARMQATAPGVSLRVVSLPPDRLEAALEDGTVDLAIGFFPDLNTNNFYQQQLSRSSFVCIARKGNPSIGKRLTLKNYLDCRHVAVSAQVRNLEVLDRCIRDLGLKERIHVSVRTPHFMAMAHIVATTDLIATATVETAQYAQRSEGVSVFTLPFASPTFPLRQHWHRRYHNDPGNQWLRRLVHEIFHVG